LSTRFRFYFQKLLQNAPIMPRNDHLISDASSDGGAVWDRQPGETSHAYQAFCAYRDAGPSRKMDQVWRAFQLGRGVIVPEHRRCASNWWVYFRTHDWKARAEKYDTHLELQHRHLRESASREKIEHHLESTRQMMVAFKGVALRMINIARVELDRKASDELAPGVHTLTSSRFSTYVRTAATLASLASEQEANALGIDELIGILNESENPI
jgi:hypothetical protein